MLKIFGAPSRYIQGAGALDSLGQTAALFGRRAALVIDRYVHGVLGPRIEALCAEHHVALTPLIVEGDLTPELIANLRAQADSAGIDFVIAVGGGKSLDAGKAVAKSSHCHLITVPTVASNDAPTSKNYVLYDAHHNLLAVAMMAVSTSTIVGLNNMCSTARRL